MWRGDRGFAHAGALLAWLYVARYHLVWFAVPTTRRHGGPADAGGSVGGKDIREYSYATGTPIAATPQV